MLSAILGMPPHLVALVGGILALMLMACEAAELMRQEGKRDWILFRVAMTLACLFFLVSIWHSLRLPGYPYLN
jgi:4-hydroxybenzoate polyprenyltransferase